LRLHVQHVLDAVDLLFQRRGDRLRNDLRIGAFTITEGGTTSGYSEIGRLNIEITPASRMIVDNTPAKIGRSIKNLEMFMTVCLSALEAARKAA
jgi:hypothetical protein